MDSYRVNRLPKSTFPVLFAVGLFVCSAGLSQFSRAQEPIRSLVKGTLAGTVVDAHGAIVSNATVFLIGAEGQSRIASTNADGRFEFAGIDPGTYDLKVEIPGFAVKSVRGIAVTVANTTSITIPTGFGLAGPPPPTISVERPVWNVWAEEASEKPRFIPVAKLKRNQTYNLVIDLAAFSYLGAEGVYHTVTSSTFTDWASKTKSDTANLDVLLIPDRRTFAPQAQNEQVRSLTVNLAKIRSVQDRKLQLDKPPFDVLRSGKDDFSFGRVTAKIRTKDFAGNGSIAVSLWSNGVPLDEFAAIFCIVDNDGDRCPVPDSLDITLRGIDSLRVASAKGNARYPDASLHFIELDQDSVVGVFRCNSCADWKKDQFVHWQIDRNAGFIARYLSSTIVHDFEVAGVTTDGFRRHGEDLYDLLFHGPEGAQAKTAFVTFLNKYPKAQAANSIPPSIFVRILPTSSDPLFLVPLGLLFAPEYGDFVGLHFRIETPLERQDYTAPSSCISTWVLAVPEEDLNKQYDDMQQARQPFASDIAQFQKATGNSTVFQDMTSFRQWLRQTNKSIVSSAVLVLSHHDSNRIYFDPADTIESVSVQRTFSVPSFVILNACGTAKPGALEFVREFNAHGVSAEVATATEVEPRMAGMFASRFVQHLREHASDSQYGVARARFDAAVDISQAKMKDGSLYGPRALIYVMLGNGAVRVCPPPAK